MKAICFIAIVFLSACKAGKELGQSSLAEAAPVVVESPVQKAGPEQEILGKWSWWKTSCCFRMPKITTASELAYERTLNFKKGGIWEQFHGDTLKHTATYQVSYGLMEGDSNLVLKMDHRPALLSIQDDTLVIDYGYMDLQTEYYLRRK